MNTWSNTVLTENGRALLAKLTQGNTLKITKAETGPQFYVPVLLHTTKFIPTPKQTLSFKPVSYPEIGKCAITVSLTNEGLTEGYTAVQVGMYAEDPDEGEILLFIAQAASAQYGTVVPSEEEMPGYSAEWTFYLQYGQANGVSVVVDPSNTVTRQEMEKFVEENAFTEITNDQIDAILAK